MRTRLTVVLLVSAAGLSACSKGSSSASDTTAAASTTASTSSSVASAAPTTAQDKIKNAMSAAPDSISGAATIMDWPATATGKPTQLRAGTNGWACFPSTPAAAGAVGEDPMCLDPQFQKWAEGYMSKKPPKVTGVGLAYMLQGDRGASISDPFASAAAPPQDWVKAGPHIMVIAPSPAALASLPSKPNGGVPWVMWKGTPYAHVMVPVKG